MKKKLEDKDRVIAEKEDTISVKDQQLGIKEKIIAQKEEIIHSLTSQLEAGVRMIEELQEDTSDGKGANDDVGPRNIILIPLHLMLCCLWLVKCLERILWTRRS